MLDSISSSSTLNALRSNLASTSQGYSVVRGDMTLANKGSYQGERSKGRLMADCKKAKRLLAEAAHSLSIYVVYSQQQEGRQPSQALLAIIAKQLKPVSITAVYK